MQTADAVFPYRVYASTREEELALVAWPPEQKDAFLHMQFDLRERQYREAYPDARTEVIFYGGLPAGTIITEQGTHAIVLVDIALLPEFRGRGIGTEILQTLKSHGKKIILHVWKQNPAARLYARLGFVPVGEDAMYLTMEWIPQ